MNHVRIKANAPDGFGGVYVFATLADFLAGAPDQFRQAFGQAAVDFPVTSIGAFAQDHWSVTRRVTVDLGVRYDSNICHRDWGRQHTTSARE